MNVLRKTFPMMQVDPLNEKQWICKGYVKPCNEARTQDLNLLTVPRRDLVMNMNDSGVPNRGAEPHRFRVQGKFPDGAHRGIRVDAPIDMVEASPWQVRRMDWGPEEESLKNNVEKFGLNQPPLARPHPTKKGWYQLVGGHRRFEACKRLGWPTIPLEVKDLSDEEAAEIGMNDNIQRKSLNPIEEARGYKMLKDEFHLTHEQLADMFDRSRSYITNSLRLLDLDLFLTACVESGALTAWQARIIFGLPPEVFKYRLATLAFNWRLTTRDLERLVAEIKNGALSVIFDREVLVEGLWFDLINIPPNWNEPPLSPNVPSVRINATGAVIRGWKAAQDAMFGGVKRLLCRIEFEVAYLKDPGELFQISSSERSAKTKPGIMPPKGEKQLKKIKRLRSLLEGHLTEYPSVVYSMNPSPDDLE